VAVVIVVPLQVDWLEFNVPFQHKYGYIQRRCSAGS